MADVNSPLIVRGTQPAHYVKPGLHSHNTKRRLQPGRGIWFLQNFRKLLLLFGICALSYYGYTLSDRYIYQRYQNWAFDQQIGGKRGVTFADYLRQQTPFGFLVGTKSSEAVVRDTAPVGSPTPEPAQPAQGSLLGRIEIPRLNLAAMVREGVDAKTLSLAVGHVPSTALPGQSGNFAIAAHRDTLFRALKDIRKDDLVTFQSPSATYTYQVAATKIVTPSDVSVLRSDGGRVIPGAEAVSDAQTPEKLLTMITCYPFYYVGSAPKRFIVEARLVSGNPSTQSALSQAQVAAAPPTDVPVSVTMVEEKPSPTRRASVHGSRSMAASSRTSRQVAASRSPKKRGFWHRLLHVS